MHLELLGTFVDDHALDGLLLCRAEYPSIAFGSASRGEPNGAPVACIKQVDSNTYGCTALPRTLHNLVALFVQPDQLLAPFMELLQCLTSCFLPFHKYLTQKFLDFMGPYL